MAVNVYSRTSFYKDAKPKKLKAGDESNGRGVWWQNTIRNTPLPGAYHVTSFIEEGSHRPVQRTYGFGDSGRKRNADPSQTGSYLMPGLYAYDDLAKRTASKQCSYSFKGPGRTSQGHRRKRTDAAATTTRLDENDYRENIGPGSYDIAGGDHHRSINKKTHTFSSQTERFPTLHFIPKEGPPPGLYDVSPPCDSHAMTSSFKSRTPRFVKPHMQKTPGPGAYTKLSRAHASVNVRHLGRYHGLFYPTGES